MFPYTAANLTACPYFTDFPSIFLGKNQNAQDFMGLMKTHFDASLDFLFAVSNLLRSISCQLRKWVKNGTSVKQHLHYFMQNSFRFTF